MKSLEIIYPLDGSTEGPTVKVSTRINVRAGGAQSFEELYRGWSICVERNNVLLTCSPMDEAFEHGDWEVGNYIVQAYFSLVREGGEPVGQRYWPSQPIAVTIISSDAFTARAAAFIHEGRTKYRAGYELSLVDWASEQQRLRPREVITQLERDNVGLTRSVGGKLEDEEELMLVIGVKTAIAANFALRQAIRETWASKTTLPRGVKVLFVGCRLLSYENEDPELEDSQTEQERRLLREAIALEQMVYGDLLADELDCYDSYLDLANKAKEFCHYVATQYPQTRFVTLADDDVYIRTDEVVNRLQSLGPQTRYYSGQVPSVQYGRKDTPNRNLTHRYSLSVEQYPLSQFPPMAMGAFFLSMDCVKFISKNRRRLRGLNGIDDVTIPLWLLTMQVHVRHQSDLGYLRAEPCSDRFVAFGDLSALALREIHGNVQQQRPFCHGFQNLLWLKPTGRHPGGVLASFAEPLQFEFAGASPYDADLSPSSRCQVTPASRYPIFLRTRHSMSSRVECVGKPAWLSLLRPTHPAVTCHSTGSRTENFS